MLNCVRVLRVFVRRSQKLLRLSHKISNLQKFVNCYFYFAVHYISLISSCNSMNVTDLEIRDENYSRSVDRSPTSEMTCSQA